MSKNLLKLESDSDNIRKLKLIKNFFKKKFAPSLVKLSDFTLHKSNENVLCQYCV